MTFQSSRAILHPEPKYGLSSWPIESDVLSFVYARFDASVAPAKSTWVPPKWMTARSAGETPRQPESNGLGDDWNPCEPVFRGIDLTRPDARIQVPDITINSPAERSKIAFVDVNILDSTGSDPYRGDVLVEGQRIVSVGTKLPAESLSSARVFEGRGRTLMSGLCDAHTHFSWTNSDSLDGLADMPVEEHTLFSAQSARTFLDCGYTMCLGAASAKQRLDMVIRNAINSGAIPGPRCLANGQEMAPRSGALIAGITRFVEDTGEIKEAVSEMANQGVDVVKFSMSGEEITEKLRAEDTTFPDELVAAGVEAAHASGIRVCSHARSDESIMQCLQYGVDIIYHGSFISEATMTALEAQKDRVFVAPALNWLYSTLNDAASFGYPLEKAESVGYARELEIAVAGLKEMKRRGVKILSGGDYGFAWTPHGTYRDLELFVKLLGFTPMESILSATALGGEIMLHPHELGKVQPGYYADLVLVNGNPLEDIGLLSHSENIEVIVVNGRIHKELLACIGQC
ncbi:hypothetical protein HD554DRAFT_2175396 [Boletus coccyginus]|nr:hypothetical protein HD554DRAFT_2175396 [Boletus coccyginus]